MKKWIGIAATLAFLAGLTFLIMQRANEVKVARAELAKPVVLPPTSVRVDKVIARDFKQTIEVTGEVRAKRSVQVFPKVGGRIEEVSTGLGQVVTKGQVLARVEENDLGWREKQGVAGERAASAAVRQAAAQLEIARTELERAKKLHADGVLPEADLTRAQGQANAAAAALGAAQAQVEVARAGSGLAKEAKSWTAVEAPIDGVITRRMADLGATAGTQQPLFEIQDQSSLEIRVDVPALALDAVKEGKEVDFTVAERPGKVFKAKVSAVGRSLDPQTRRVRVELLADGAVVADGVLPAMMATVSIKLSERAGVLGVPRSAIVAMADGPAVFIVRDGVAKRVVPEVMQADRTHVPVLTGVTAGELVVVEGQDSLEDGTPVKIVDQDAGAATP